MDPADVRSDYAAPPLRRADLAAEPLGQLQAWFDEAAAAGLPDPNAMAIATVDDDGLPDLRWVLWRGSDHGLIFYTNRQSAKGRQLAANPRAAALFGWLAQHRQVRVRGEIEIVDDATSDAYFDGRPRASRISAIASPQSHVVANREELDALREATTAAIGDGPIARPDHWGGYRLVPTSFEFWQGRRDRYHDRIRYRRDEGGTWVRERLAP